MFSTLMLLETIFLKSRWCLSLWLNENISIGSWAKRKNQLLHLNMRIHFAFLFLNACDPSGKLSALPLDLLFLSWSLCLSFLCKRHLSGPFGQEVSLLVVGVTGLIGDWKLWNQMVWVQNLLHHLEAGTWAGCFTSLCLGSVLIKQLSCHFPASPGGSAVKNLPAVQEPQEMWVQSLDRKDPLEGGYGNPLQYSCLENLHGQRSLAGYSP